LEKLKYRIKRILQFLLNPHLTLCFAIAWMITNGWSYVGAVIGPILGWEWLTAVSTAYLAMLWFPFTPEKLITAFISIGLLKKLYPDDQKTLKVLEDFREKVRAKHRSNMEAFRNRREERKRERAVSRRRAASDMHRPGQKDSAHV